jgi:hypothetical protein
MPVPVWLFPAAKAVGKWALTNGGPPLVTLAKKYGPSAFRGYREHGFKPKQIVTYVMAENGSVEPQPAVAKAPKRRTRLPKK